VQWLFAAIQIALAVVLLTGAGLLIRSFRELSRVSPGFDASRIVTFHISGSYGETNDFARLTTRMDRTLEFLRSIPGVEAAATASALPGVPGRYQTEVTLLEGRADSEPKLIVDSRFVSSSYFSTVRIPLLAGEICRHAPAGAFGGVLVNRSFADAYFPGSSPIGHRLTANLGGQISPTLTIQGIVANAREQGLHRAPGPTVYWCSAFDPTPFFLIRISGEPGGIAETLRRALKGLEPSRAVFGIMPLEEHLDDAYRENRLRTMVLATFAAAAVMLACVGLYGTLSYLVNSRRREVGLRLALGARRGQIVRRILVQGLAVSALACAAGLGLSLLSSRWLASMLYGVSPSDPLTLALVTVIVLTGATLASLIPAARGALVEPMRVLRDD
jgi:putative ABC transport system permease protein